MTSTEIAVVVGGALLGYWVVSSLLGSKPDRAKREGRTFDDASWQKSRQEQEEQIQDHQPHEENYIPASWFRILEVAEYASKDEICTAYKQKIRQYHPDKVATLGPELRELAEFKSKQINAAYDYALNLRG